MKRLEFYLKFLPLIVVFAFITAGCSKNNQEKEVSFDEGQALDVTFTPCVQSEVKNVVSNSNNSIDVAFTNGEVQIVYRDFEVTCDFNDVNVLFSAMQHPTKNSNVSIVFNQSEVNAK